MNYQICYTSPQGHAKKLAFAFQSLFPTGTAVVDLDNDPCRDSDFCLIGFELTNGNANEMMNILSGILPNFENRNLLLFATCPVVLSEVSHRSLEMNIKSRLPRDCRFYGLYVCRGAVSKTTIKELGGQLRRSPDDEKIAALLEEYRLSKGHPNRNDVRFGCRVIADALKQSAFH